MTTNPPAATDAGRAAARRSLEALALGDVFGERWFPLFREPRQSVNEIRARRTPPEPRWHWTDDTAPGPVVTFPPAGRRLARTLAALPKCPGSSATRPSRRLAIARTMRCPAALRATAGM
ncbi:hypothetical protein ACFXMQ_23785 [Streptomyces anulatus]|uniref:hypothetical protein n=1 Tax=Streptomyces anulatus TaxID=1892 RepID=UPI003680C2A6